MKIYKLLHKDTGLYYTPNKEHWDGYRTNLSKKGKIYQGHKPPKGNFSSKIYVSNVLVLQYAEHDFINRIERRGRQCYLKTIPSDWELIEKELDI